MIRNRLLAILIAVGGTVGGTAAVSTASASAAGLTGAGSTLVNPLMQNWINGFEIKEGIPVKYSSVGSGEGIKLISNGSVDFGASDAPMTPEQEAKCSGCVTIPWALSATGLGFNVPGVKKLNLSGKVIAGIYFGKITNWNDPKIAKLNPKAKLPNLAITPIYRSDGSGDTYAFTNYLSKISPAWTPRSRLRHDGRLESRYRCQRQRRRHLDGRQDLGAIGYISASYLIAAGIHAVAVENNAGAYELPNLKNIEEAGSSVKLSSNNTASITNPPKKYKNAYPISTFTYAIVPHSAPQKQYLEQFLYYDITKGQAYGAALDFAPLPKSVVTAAKAAIASL